MCFEPINAMTANLINAWALNQDVRPETLPLLFDEIYFNEITLLDGLVVDLAKSVKLVIIQSPYVALAAVKRLQPTLKTLIDKGVRICVFLRDPGSSDWNTRNEPATDHSQEAVKLLRSMGVHVCFRQRIHQKIVIIDSSVSYFGSLNILSFNPKHSAEGMIRSSNPVKAFWLMLFFALNACSQCLEARANASRISLSLTTKSIGALISRIRKTKSLSQDEIAQRLKISRPYLSEIERGKAQPGYKTILGIGALGEQELLLIPKEIVPFVEEFVRLFPNQEKRKESN